VLGERAFDESGYVVDCVSDSAEAVWHSYFSKDVNQPFGYQVASVFGSGSCYVGS